MSSSVECSSNSDSGPNSPPAGPHGALPNGNLTSLHSKEVSVQVRLKLKYCLFPQIRPSQPGVGR